MSPLSPVDTARAYYDSADADAFYHSVWGGEDIHIGLYEGSDESIYDASRRTVIRMAEGLEGIGPGSRVLDLGSGYAGAARYLARTHGCHVTALNLSEVENERARLLNRGYGLADSIEVVEGSFERIPAEDRSFDFVWSNDALLHSGDRASVLAEVARVLRGGGIFIFTDPMRADDCSSDQLGPILGRLHLRDLGSPGWYRRQASVVGLDELGFEELTAHLVRHYTRVLEETALRADDLRERISGEYLARMSNGLEHWIEGGRAGHLSWGIFRFRRR